MCVRACVVCVLGGEVLRPVQAGPTESRLASSKHEDRGMVLPWIRRGYFASIHSNDDAPAPRVSPGLLCTRTVYHARRPSRLQLLFLHTFLLVGYWLTLSAACSLPWPCLVTYLLYLPASSQGQAEHCQHHADAFILYRLRIIIDWCVW